MEPFVVLTRFDTPRSGAAVHTTSLHSGAVSSLSTRPRKGKGKKARFERRKKWYSKGCEHTLPSFKGWKNVYTDAEFGEVEQDESYVRVVRATIDNEDLVTFSETKITSISADSADVFTFTVVPTPVRRIRILSLCGGIESGLLIVSKLGFEIDIYFSTEIDVAALTVQRHRYPGQIVALGCMRKLTNPNFLATLGRIDLVLASPPCNGVSLTNACRRELNHTASTAFLTLDCVKIIKHFRRTMYQQRYPFFYLMEQTAHMSRSVRAKITEAMGHDPHTICSSRWVPMFRRRLYFNNLPGAGHVESLAKGKFCSAGLQQYLDPYRQARVSYARTITTNTSNQGLPVTEGGVPVKLSLTERESIMGFPKNYTACGDISVVARRRLLGKAWCTHVVLELLRPLVEIYRN